MNTNIIWSSVAAVLRMPHFLAGICQELDQLAHLVDNGVVGVEGCQDRIVQVVQDPPVLLRLDIIDVHRCCDVAARCHASDDHVDEGFPITGAPRRGFTTNNIHQLMTLFVDVRSPMAHLRTRI